LVSPVEKESTIQAVVQSLDGREAIVEVEAGGCGRCHEKGGCGGQQLTQMFCSGPKTYRVDNALGASPGDRVTVAIAAGSVRRTANLAYGIPLTATIAGAALGTSLAGDAGAMLGAGFGLVMSFAYIRSRARDGAGKYSERPYIISRS
jgi:sigma-E factor negative regulatory protein RseC